LKGTPLKENISLDSVCQAGDFKLFSENEPKPTSKTESAETIYTEYPRRESKPAAIKAILKALKTNSPDFLLERTQAYAAAIGWKDRQFIPHPATWFNNERFNDNPQEWEQPNKSANQPTRPPVNTGPRTANIEYV
jgi:hypothetical protein